MFLSLAIFLALSLNTDAHVVIRPNSKISTARQYTIDDLYANWPTYDQLPLDSSYPTKAAWGVWGANDSNGALNHITSATRMAASKEIQLGTAFNLNYELESPSNPINPNRKPLIHLFQPGDGYTDDVVVMNTQISTQFDGLRHFPYSTNNDVNTYQWYNNLIANYEEVIGPAPSTVLGMQMSAQYGIAGRGVLLDWAGWAQSQKMKYDAFSARPIPISELEATATWQGITNLTSFIQPGDMLFLRTGWTAAYRALSPHAQNVLSFRVNNANHIGMLANDESAAWLWEKKLALVGADNPAFEMIPFNGTIGGVARSLHQVFIGGWGQSIVEFLDFEVLAPTLHMLKRSTFFVTIQNLNVVSGIASPPNALAII